jgi:integrase
MKCRKFDADFKQARFMLATGQRIGECLAVLWMDVDVDRGQIQVAAAPS